jgi:hypothetical protein
MPEQAINHEELAICRRRGHVTPFSLKAGWLQCEKCGMWLRDVVTREEREDEPPENERNPVLMLRPKAP